MAGHVVALVTGITEEKGFHVTGLVAHAAVLTVLALPLRFPAAGDQLVAVLQVGFGVRFKVTVFADPKVLMLAARNARRRPVAVVAFGIE